MTDVFIESEEEMQEKGILMEHIYRTALDEGMFE